jgi:hypothetical protein
MVNCSMHLVLVHNSESGIQCLSALHRPDVSQLWRGNVLDDDLLRPAVISIPGTGPIGVMNRARFLGSSVNVASDAAVMEDLFHVFLPLMPIVVHQMVTFSDLANTRVVLSTEQSNLLLRLNRRRK